MKITPKISLNLGVLLGFSFIVLLMVALTGVTSLIGPISALWAAYWLSPYYLVAYGMLVILTRLFYTLLLTVEGHRMSAFDIPMLLYTQWMGSLVKVYTMFHLHRQKWDAHRQSESDPRQPSEPLLDRLIPKMQMAFSFAMLVLFVTLLVNVKK